MPLAGAPVIEKVVLPESVGCSMVEGREIKHHDILCPKCHDMVEFSEIGIHLMKVHKLKRGTKIDPHTGKELRG